MDRDGKCSALAELKKRKRGHNRVLIGIVYNMLEPYVLPLKHDEDILSNRNSYKPSAEQDF